MILDRDYLNRFPVVKLKKGAIILYQGQDVTYFYYLTSGICAGVDVKSNGSYAIALFYYPGDLIGIAQEFVQNDHTQLGTVLVKTDAYAYKIPAETFRTYMQQNFAVYRNVAASIFMSEKKMLDISRMRIKGNSVAVVCHTMLSLVQTMDKDQETILYIDKVFTVTEISQYLQMHRVTVSKILSRLCEELVMQKQKYGWEVLNISELKKYAAGEKTLINLY